MSEVRDGIPRVADWIAGWVFALAAVFEWLRRERRAEW